MEFQESESHSNSNGEDFKSITFYNKSVRQLRSEGFKVHSGKWSDNEKKQLKTNWKKFFMIHPFENSELYRTSRLSHDKHRLFKGTIAYNLLRTWNNISVKIVEFFDPLCDSELSHSDKINIEEAYFQKGQKDLAISINLKLPIMKTKKHIQFLKGRKKISHGTWSEMEDAELMQAILLTHDKESLESLKYARDIKFDKVADVLKIRNYRQCYNRFYLSLQPRLSNNSIERRNTWLSLDYIDLISAMDMYECMQEVDYYQIQSKFRDFKSVQLLSKKMAGVRRLVPSKNKNKFKHMINYIKHNFFPLWEKKAQLRSEYKCKNLKKLLLPTNVRICEQEVLNENSISLNKFSNESKLEDSDETSSCSSSDEN